METAVSHDNAFILVAIFIYIFSIFLIVATLMELPFLFDGKRLAYLEGKFGKSRTKGILVGFSLLIIAGISIRIYFDFFST